MNAPVQSQVQRSPKVISPEEFENVEPTPIVSIPDLPDSLREHRAIVDFTEWVITRYPWRLSLHNRVRQRLLSEEAA